MFGEQPDVLERAGHARPATTAQRLRAAAVAAVERDLALGRDVQAGEAVEEGRLAGAVRADQTDDLALADVRSTSLTAEQTTEPHGHAAGLEHQLRDGPRRAGRGSR